MNNNEMTLSLKSDTFAALKEDFDGVLARTIGNMEMKNADNATITLKLGITLDKVSVGTPNGNQDITRPSFKHDISSVMQVKDRKSGALTGDYELIYEDGKYVMRRIDDGQTSLYDEKVEKYEGPVTWTTPMSPRTRSARKPFLRHLRLAPGSFLQRPTVTLPMTAMTTPMMSRRHKFNGGYTV